MVLITTEKCIRVNFQIQVVCIDSSNKNTTEIWHFKKKTKKISDQTSKCMSMSHFLQVWASLNIA